MERIQTYSQLKNIFCLYEKKYLEFQRNVIVLQFASLNEHIMKTVSFHISIEKSSSAVAAQTVIDR